MEKKKIFFASLGSAACLALARSGWEVRHLKTARYKIISDKLPGNTHKNIVFLTDLHCRTYGKRNIELLRMVKSNNPDFILIGGDMIKASGTGEKSDTEVMAFIKALKKIAPVYYALGNHEEYLRTEKYRFGDRYEKIKTFLDREKIPVLANSHIDLDDNISVYGLEISRKYYERFNRKPPKKSHMIKCLKKPDKSRYNILLAHNPAYFDVYETWKPDLVLSGHYHGGIVRLPVLGGVISPNFTLFPDYCEGKFRKNNTDLIVSAGCGSHDINIRLFNRPEVVLIELSSETERV